MPGRVDRYRQQQPVPILDPVHPEASKKSAIAKEAAALAGKLTPALKQARKLGEKVAVTAEKIEVTVAPVVPAVLKLDKPCHKTKFTAEKIINGTLEVLSYVPSVVEFFTKVPIVKQLACVPGFVIDIFLTGKELLEKTRSSRLHNRWIRQLEPELPQLEPEKLQKDFSALIEGVKGSGQDFGAMRDELHKWGIYLEKYSESKNAGTAEELLHLLENKKFLKKIFPDYAHKAASVEGAKRLLKKSEERFHQKIEEKRGEFKAYITGLNGTLPDIKKKLIARGMDLDAIPEARSIKTAFELRAKLVNPAFEETLFKPLLKQYATPQAEKELAKSTLLRNPLHALSLMKQKAEKIFFSFKLWQARHAFAITLLSSVAIVAIKVMIVAGVISVPTWGTSLIGVAAAAAILGVAALGLFLLYRHKPESFKEMMKLTNLRLLEKRVEAACQHWMHDRKKDQFQDCQEALQVYKAHALKDPSLMPREFNSAKAKSLAERIQKSKRKHAGDALKLEEIDNILYRKMEKYALKKLKLDIELQDREEKEAKAKGQKDALRDRLAQAGWKDFQKRVKLSGVEGPDGDLARRLAQAMAEVYQDGEMDAEVQKMLKDEMGIEVAQELDENGSQGLESAFRKFFGKNQVQMEKFVHSRFAGATHA